MDFIRKRNKYQCVSCLFIPLDITLFLKTLTDRKKFVVTLVEISLSEMDRKMINS